MSEFPEDVRQAIRDVQAGRSTTLSLAGRRGRGKGLREIPEEVFALSGLEELILFNNDIRIIPNQIRELPKLRKLDVRRNPIERLPDMPGVSMDWESYVRCRAHLSPPHVIGLEISIGETQDQPTPVSDPDQLLHAILAMPNLINLDIGLTAIVHQIPLHSPEPAPAIRQILDQIAELRDLEGLTLFGILLGRVPDGIRTLRQIKHLCIAGGALRNIPSWISELPNLTSLVLSLNHLTSLPASLGNLAKLSRLDVGENNFSHIPQVIFRIQMLEYLRISKTAQSPGKARIRDLPSSFLTLPHLKTLRVEGQPIEIPPPEVVSQGVEAIKNYWRQRLEVGVDYLCEAKLLIVGEAGAGKTSLARKIENPAYGLKPREPSTEGIDVIRWGFPAAIRTREGGAERLLKRDFSVNVWDFGGQEIYHATHQFFLTRRSLYLLVADDRKEDTDFNWWLEVVELLSDGSPLLIVQNEKQGRRRDINFSSLRARFPNLKAAYRTNLATNEGLGELIGAIRQELERLPHIGTPLPATWKRVREALERDDRNYIGVTEFFAICEAEGFKRDEDKLQLSDYLHDLGICLHFQDDPILKHCMILKPKWATDAVYRVLDDRDVVNERGRFNREDLVHIWQEDAYAAMRDELLRLMMRFQLCYELPAGGTYIAPELLSSDQPSLDWDQAGNLVLRYAYEFMPKGILTRFIVALNHLIADQQLVWKTGVVLAREGTRALVVEDYARRQILVRVAGADGRGLLAIVDDQLERIHRSFPLLKYEKYLPCRCPVCTERAEPYSFALKELEDFARTGDLIQCRVSRKLVDPASLIRDIMPSASRRADLVPEPGLSEREAAPKPDSKPVKEVFVSYAWKSEESVSVVDQLEQAFKERDIRLIRDKSEMNYKDLIRGFMQRLGRGKCIVVVLSKAYLMSKSCMFELTEIAERGDLRGRVFPIVMDDADIHNEKALVEYIEHWETKKRELDAAMKRVGSENLEGIRETIDLYAKIRTTAARIIEILADMNALTPEKHRGSNFEALFSALEHRLSE
jgi:Leucine-rich repeat (LRR) protein